VFCPIPSSVSHQFGTGSRGRYWAAITLTMLVALIASMACGGSAPASSGQSAGVVKNIKVGTFVSTSVLAPLVADRMGYMRQNGLNAQFVTFQDVNSAVTALLTGGVDFLDSASNRPALIAQANGPSIKIVVGTYLTATDVWLVRPNSKLNHGDSLAGLKGMTIDDGGPATQSRFANRILLKQAGLDPDKDVTWQTVPLNSAAIATWESGVGDVLVEANETPAAVLLRGTGKLLLDETADHTIVSTWPIGAVLSKEDYVSTHQAEVQAYATATCQGIKESKANPDKATELLLEYFRSTTGTNIDVNSYTESIKTAINNSWGTNIEPANLTAYYSALYDAGTLKKKYTFDDFVAKQFTKYWTC
jgi:NitT/TauT family transport system substrate-binding protein